jgi:antitoxin component of RelBE/YafQ-DinJ toxin-antitoxin module
MNATQVRETQLNVRLSDEERERLERVAAHYGLSGPNVLRMLLKRDAERLERDGVIPPAAKAPRGKK